MIELKRETKIHNDEDSGITILIINRIRQKNQ